MPSIEVDIQTTAEVDIEVFCANCGAGLCNKTSSGRTKRRGQAFFEVEPCEKCIDRKYDEGYGDGYAQAEKDIPSSPSS